MRFLKQSHSVEKLEKRRLKRTCHCINCAHFLKCAAQKCPIEKWSFIPCRCMLKIDVPSATLNNETADRAWERFLSTESSFVTDVIAGQLESILECKECSFKSVTYESFFQMSLPIPSEEVRICQFL